MEPWSLGVLILGIAVAVAVLFLIPSLLQLNRTLKSAERFLDDMDTSLKSLIYDEVKPLVRSVNNTMDEVEGIVRSAREGVDKMDEALEAFRGLGGALRTISGLIDTGVKGAASDLGAYIVGFKVGLGTLIKNLKSLRKREVA